MSLVFLGARLGSRKETTLLFLLKESIILEQVKDIKRQFEVNGQIPSFVIDLFME